MVKLLTCGKCGSSLRVHASGGAHFTEIVQAVAAVQRGTERAADAAERATDELLLARLRAELSAAESADLTRRARNQDREDSARTERIQLVGAAMLCGVVALIAHATGHGGSWVVVSLVFGAALLVAAFLKVPVSPSVRHKLMRDNEEASRGLAALREQVAEVESRLAVR